MKKDFYNAIKRVFKEGINSELSDNEEIRKGDEPVSYQLWARRCERLRFDELRVLGAIERLNAKPLISVFLILRKGVDPAPAIQSIVNQFYSTWELFLIQDTFEDISNIHQTEYPNQRVILIEENGGAEDPLARAIENSKGEMIAFLEQNDLLTPDAFYELVAAASESNADLVYSDEDRISDVGDRVDPTFKPAWSPDLLLSRNYIGSFWLCRRSLLGGLDVPAREYRAVDALLRLTERASRIAHVPKILYHRQSYPNGDRSELQASLNAVSAALERRKIDGSAVGQSKSPVIRIVRRLNKPGKVSILIPTRDRVDLLRECVSSIESLTDYPLYEIVIVDNESSDHATLDYLNQTSHRVIREPGEFNFSRINNQAAAQVDGEYLLLLNNDTRVLNREWLSAMVEHAQRPEVGAVGARLLYPGGTTQHGGVVLGVDGIADHLGRLRPPNGDERFDLSTPGNEVRNCSAVTGACLLIRRATYYEIGGLNERDLGVSFNDVDLCLRLRKAGFAILWTPFAQLLHPEFGSRNRQVDPKELSWLCAHRFAELMDDPHFNPNLSISRGLVLDVSKPESLFCGLVQTKAEALVWVKGPGYRIEQEFKYPSENLSAISVRFAARPIPGGNPRRLLSDYD